MRYLWQNVYTSHSLREHKRYSRKKKEHKNTQNAPRCCVDDQFIVPQNEKDLIDVRTKKPRIKKDGKAESGLW